MTFQELPVEIQELAKQECVALRGYEPNPDECIWELFDYDLTDDGEIMWNDIENGDFDLFYERYPKNTLSGIKLCLI